MFIVDVDVDESQMQIGPKLLPWLVVSTPLEANCRRVHQFAARRKYAKAE